MILKLVLLLDDAIMAQRSLCIEIIHIQRKFMKPHTQSTSPLTFGEDTSALHSSLYFFLF